MSQWQVDNDVPRTVGGWLEAGMAKQITVCPVADLPPGAVTGAGPYAIGNIDGKYFAVTRRCRHLRADLAGGSIEDGRLVCPWHQSAYDVENGQMVRGPQQIFAKIPGLGTTFKMLTKVWPLGRGTVSVSGNDIVVE